MEKILNVTVPKGWSELSQEQLRFLFGTIVAVNRANANTPFLSQADYAEQTSAQVQTQCFFKWSGITIICPYGTDWLAKFDEREFILSKKILPSAISALDWIRELPMDPVRLETINGSTAIAADISTGLSFDEWLACETLWQRYQQGPDDALLQSMARILYKNPDIELDAAETLNIFYWWSGIKNMVAVMFPYFFKSSGGDASGDAATTYDDMRRNIDAQIRALTKGDITKESEILSLNAIRALTELDAQAREYEELNRKYPSK